MSFDETHRDNDAEAQADFRADDLKKAREAVFNAAGDLGLLDDDAEELTPETLKLIAEKLAGWAFRLGPCIWPAREATLRRAFDALREVDEGAAKAEREAAQCPF